MRRGRRDGFGRLAAAMAALALATASASAEPPCVEPRPVDFRGWKAFELANDGARVVVVPDIGGRVMSYRGGDHEVLWSNPALAGRLFTPDEHTQWKNYGGSKVWPAPQGTPAAGKRDRWPGPPDPVLDGGRYEGRVARTDRGPAVEVVSPKDEYSGLQISRRIALERDSTRARLENTITNVSTRDVAWGVWQVTQVDAGSAGPSRINDRLWFYCPKGTGPRDGAKGFQVMAGPADNPTWQGEVAPGILGCRFAYRVGKFGALSPGGWAASVDEATGWAFVERFEFASGAAHPDDATVEMWSQGTGVFGTSGGDRVEFKEDFENNPALIESEVLGPLVTLKPGESRTLTVRWGLARCCGPILAATPAGVVGRRLAWDAQTKRLEGRYGVFGPGALRLVFEDGAGKRLAEEIARPSATPQEEQAISRSGALPEGAKTVRVVWRGAGGEEGELDALGL